MENTIFDTLNALDVNKYVETKNTGKIALKYLSWSNAWQEVKKRYPDAKATVKMFDNKPYVFDEKTGYMVFTEVTINGETQEMWLPVMDSHNEAMFDKPRTVKTKCSSFTVDACTMFDVNKTIMRCMAKNLAMFGLGLYIYNGEDLPENIEPEQKVRPQYKPIDKSTMSDSAINLDCMLNQYRDSIRPDVMQKCSDAVRSGDENLTNEMTSKLVAYLKAKNIEVN